MCCRALWIGWDNNVDVAVVVSVGVADAVMVMKLTQGIPADHEWVGPARFQVFGRRRRQWQYVLKAQHVVSRIRQGIQMQPRPATTG
eukprot:CAMPEP_0168786456 /NCGR_PEP_ID=MMETSP0725-20121227/11281_1 /TAXON_ID=265536 /ORGANISM="Amphiprora sp., Strain CCMP467" /LENGTH=86 /DNA_ID=CAMNT_0008836605 /DNA_START=27 /DNA_END=287 /DNA_ORIENTATION=+